MQTNIIKITSFYPFRNFLRITQEFYEDKATVKVKSLTFEHEYQFDYKDVAKITDSFSTDSDQRDFGVYLMVFGAFPFVFFYNFVSTHPFLLRIEQVLYVIGLFLFLTSFAKRWHVNILDKNNKYLTYIRENKRNRELMLLVLEAIANKSKGVEEVSTVNPFPDESPIYELVEFNFSKLTKTTDRYYQDELAGLQESIFQENSYKVKYTDLSKKLYRGKANNDTWNMVLYIAFILLTVIVGLEFNFGIDLGKIGLLLWGFPTVAGIVLWLFSFIKREIVGMYDKNEDIVYWIYINRKDKAKVEEIIKFVHSKIPE